MSAEADAAAGAELDEELASLLSVERFEPPKRFKERALLKDPVVYERAAADPLGWWTAQAEALDWFQRWERVLDDDDPPEWLELISDEKAPIQVYRMRPPSPARPPVPPGPTKL